jgi:hypothetical protein
VKCVQHECTRGSRRKNASPSAAREPQRTTFSGGGRARHTVEAIDATTPFEAKFPPSCSEAKIKGKTGVSKGVVARSARRCGPLFWQCVGVQPKRCQRAPLKASSQKGNPWVYGGSRYMRSVRDLGAYHVPRGCTEGLYREGRSAQPVGTTGRHVSSAHTMCRERVPSNRAKWGHWPHSFNNCSDRFLSDESRYCAPCSLLHPWS